MKVAVLMGGVSSEREVSLMTGEGIVNNLNKEKYEVYPIVINNKSEVLEKVKNMDFVFLALHGEFGEDGSIQALLESIDMPYSGSGVLSSALCMNKILCKKVLKGENINVASEVVVRHLENLDVNEIENLRYPMVVKPNKGGSSVGTFLVNNEYELRKAIIEAFKYDKEVLVEKYLNGKEYTVPVLNGKALPILEIEAKGVFYDYQSKYTDGGAEKHIADLSKRLEKEIKSIAEKCYSIFNCKAYARIDIIVSNDIPYVLELNTLPGMTKNSLFPKSAKAIGMEYEELLDRIIEYSLRKDY